ncbi:CLUMA_CG018516, isoform A [Clunio marinus]|uniref:CLUMA_CG018516, isoform A n=1 Tax=Clunio marinus TaxID=568069 RepID=A0A1J1IZ59_9DIPT|nr:CLUMA_CG018516, isoform A [Clunio marinus]
MKRHYSEAKAKGLIQLKRQMFKRAITFVIISCYPFECYIIASSVSLFILRQRCFSMVQQFHNAAYQTTFRHVSPIYAKPGKNLKLKTFSSVLTALPQREKNSNENESMPTT